MANEEKMLLNKTIEKLRQRGEQAESEVRLMGAIVPDLVVHHAPDAVRIVEVRKNRINLSYIIGRMLQHQLKLQDKGYTVQLTLALPENEINSTVYRKCEESGIELLAIDVDITQPEKINITLNLSEEYDSDLIDWLREIPGGKMQFFIKDVLRKHLEFENNRALLEKIFSGIEEIQNQIQSINK